MSFANPSISPRSRTDGDQCAGSADGPEQLPIVVAHLLAGGLIEICGPLFWGAIAIGWALAEFSLS
jgi:hypothetical protein